MVGERTMNSTLGSTGSVGTHDVLHTNGEELVRRTKRKVEDLRGAAAEHNKLTLLKGSEELIRHIHEVLRDIDEQSSKILLTINTSTTVYDKLQILSDAVNDISNFFEEVKGTKFMFFAKGKLRRHMVLNYQQLKSKCTDLMSAVSLELLTNKDLILDTPEPAVVNSVAPAPVDPYVRLEEKYMDGCRSFYGIDCPKNFNIAADLFMYAADRDHTKSMVMLAEMYKRGYSVEQDENICINWLERAASLGSSAAKYHLALKMTIQVRFACDDDFCGDCHNLRISMFFTQLPIDINSNPANFEEFSTLSEPEQFRQVISSLDVKSTMKAFDAALDSRHEEKENEERTLEDARFHVIHRAVQLLLSSASDGHVEANTELGQSFEVVGDYEEAAQWYAVAIDGGCLRAKNFLAMLHFTGKGVPCKLETANEMFFDAARGGNSSAYNNIGLCFERGYGVDMDIDKAMKLYLKGALLGSPHSMYSLGFVNVKQALARDSDRSSVVTHRRRNNGLDSVRSTSEAVALVRHVTTGESSDYTVMDSSGSKERLMRSGVRWLRRAAELSVAEAGYQLGLLYEQGTGLPRDYTAAYEQFLWAAERGNQRASLHAARMLYDEARNLEDSSEVGDIAATEKYQDRYNAAAVLFRYAAEYGISEAMNSLGLMLEDGSAKVDGRPDHAEAARWYLAAAGAGSIEAAGNLALLLAAKGEGFDFPESGMVTSSGHRFSCVELEAWLDNLAQKATGNPRAEWLRDAVARLSGRTAHRQFNKRHASPERSRHDHIPRIMVTNATPTNRKALPDEPLFNLTPAFSKRQANPLHSTHVGGPDAYHPMHRSAELENARVHRQPVEVLSKRPENKQMHHREPISTTYAKSLYPSDEDKDSNNAQRRNNPNNSNSEAHFDSNLAPHVSDPSANWGRRQNPSGQDHKDVMETNRDDEDNSDGEE